MALEAPPSAVRMYVALVLVFVVGVVVGRLVLERTGTGLVVLAVLLPFLFVLGAATLGIGRAALLIALFAGTALLVRVLAQGSGWVALLLVPPLALSVYIAAQTVRVMLQGKGNGKGT